MKNFILPTVLCVRLLVVAYAQPESIESKIAEHREGASVVADAQDELAADVQQLVIEQTLPEVISLLKVVEGLMDVATNRLAYGDTGGETMAAQTEIIEKIHAATKERQEGGSQSEAGGAMMEMMERMMGRKPEGQGDEKGKDGKAGENAGEGNGGESDPNGEANDGASGGQDEERRVPKAAGGGNQEIPEEFRKLLDAYNRGAEALVK
jgi:hypothetical protein